MSEVEVGDTVHSEDGEDVDPMILSEDEDDDDEDQSSSSDDDESYSSSDGSNDSMTDRYLPDGTRRQPKRSAAGGSVSPTSPPQPLSSSRWPYHPKRLSPVGSSHRSPLRSLSPPERRQVFRQLGELPHTVTLGRRSPPRQKAHPAAVKRGTHTGHLALMKAIRKGHAMDTTGSVGRVALSTNGRSNPASRVTRLLPPIERQPLPSVVMRSAESGEARVRLVPRTRISTAQLEAMGYQRREESIPAAAASATGLTNKAKSPKKKHRRHSSFREAFWAKKGTGDEALPPPSGGPIESQLQSSSRYRSGGKHVHLRDEQQQDHTDTVELVFSHLPAHLRPPVLAMDKLMSLDELAADGVHHPPVPPLTRNEEHEAHAKASRQERDGLLVKAALERNRRRGVTNREASDEASDVRRGSDAVGLEEATPKPEGTDDRKWGCAVKDPQGEAAARLRHRLEMQQSVPANTPVTYGAVEHLIELCTPAPEDDSDGSDSDSDVDMNERSILSIGSAGDDNGPAAAVDSSLPAAAAEDPFEKSTFRRRRSMVSFAFKEHGEGAEEQEGGQEGKGDDRSNRTSTVQTGGGGAGGGLLGRRRTSLYIPPPMADSRRDELFVLSVGFNGTSDDVALPYAEAERNAMWFAKVMTHIGATVRCLTGYQATTVAARVALSALIRKAKKAASHGKVPKLVVYYSGRARLAPNGDVWFATVEAFPHLSQPTCALMMNSGVNLTELSHRDIDPSATEGPQQDGGVGAAVAEEDFLSATKQRWRCPVVITDVLLSRTKSDDLPPPPRANTPAEKMDFWRPTYLGALMAPLHEGGSLRVQCSSRHHGLVVYYFLKCAEGRLSAATGHVGSVSLIAQYIGDRIRKRHIPTLELECPPLPHGFASRTAEELFHPDKVLYRTPAQKRAAKKARDLKPCRFSFICEVDIGFRHNPNLFVTLLSRRVKELLYSKSYVKRPAQAPPLLMWCGSRRLEHRFYLPLTESQSTDVLRYDLLSAMTRSSIGSTVTGQFQLEMATESVENTRFDYCKADHCIVAHSQGTAHNRWSKSPASVPGALSTQESVTANALRLHTDLDVDFVFVLAQLLHHKKDLEVLSFVDEKHVVDYVTVHGSGTVNDLRRILKFIRFGTLDIQFCRNCRVERVEVTSLGENEEEMRAALLVQKVVRRFLTARVMRSRLAMACTFHRQYTDMWAQSYEEWLNDLVNWQGELLEGCYAVLDRSQHRQRFELRVEEHRAHRHTLELMCKAWVELQERCRMALYSRETVDVWMLKKWSTTIPLFGEVSHVCRDIMDVERLTREEYAERSRAVIAEYAGQLALRSAHSRLLEEVAELRKKNNKTKSKKRRQSQVRSMENGYVAPLSRLLLL